MSPHFIAKFGDKLSYIVRLLPKNIAVKIYSLGRSHFMACFYKSKSKFEYVPQANFNRTLWGLNFRSPIMNSAGMFKNGEGYSVVARQGAAGYLGGTSTSNPRSGNTVCGIKLPFLTLPKSHVTINYLGLPNLGDKILSRIDITTNKSCPIGWSLMRSPDFDEQVGLENLVKSLWLYHENKHIDFLEINESCPNIRQSSDNITKRLEYIGERFLAKRHRHLPVIVKLSTDINTDSLKNILNVLFKYKYDGINLGNTSTDYTTVKEQLVKNEVRLFEYFVKKFTGGIGGNPLKIKSYNLCKFAVEYKNSIKGLHEFHVIRSGGISNIADIYDSDSIGVSLNQWYSGYFTNYINDGDLLYKKFLNGYVDKSKAMV